MSNSPLDALNNSDYVCFVEDHPEILYGPLSPADAMRFCEAYNEFFTEHDVPLRWIAKPVVMPTNNPVFSL